MLYLEVLVLVFCIDADLWLVTHLYTAMFVDLDLQQQTSIN